MLGCGSELVVMFRKRRLRAAKWRRPSRERAYLKLLLPCAACAGVAGPQVRALGHIGQARGSRAGGPDYEFCRSACWAIGQLRLCNMGRRYPLLQRRARTWSHLVASRQKRSSDDVKRELRRGTRREDDDYDDHDESSRDECLAGVHYTLRIVLLIPPVKAPRLHHVVFQVSWRWMR
jgi:hypothetical protein